MIYFASRVVLQMFGGAGIGASVVLGGMLYFDVTQADQLRDGLLNETRARYEIAARLGTCEATRNALREGREIDNAIPDNLDTFVLPDAWWMRPVERPVPD